MTASDEPYEGFFKQAERNFLEAMKEGSGFPASVPLVSFSVPSAPEASALLASSPEEVVPDPACSVCGGSGAVGGAPCILCESVRSVE